MLEGEEEQENEGEELYPSPALRSLTVRPEHLLMWDSREPWPEKWAWGIVAVWEQENNL